jgi:hypothetical protein
MKIKTIWSCIKNSISQNIEAFIKIFSIQIQELFIKIKIFISISNQILSFLNKKDNSCKLIILNRI